MDLQWQLTHLPKLVNKIVLQDGTGCKVVTNIHKGRQGSGCEALDSLHRGRGWVCTEGVQAALERLGWDMLLQHRQLVLVGSWRRVAGVKAGEVYLQGVDDEDDSPAEPRLGATEIQRLISGVQHVTAGAGPVHLQPHQQEAAHEKVDAHKVHGTQPEEQGQHGQSIHP